MKRYGVEILGVKAALALSIFIVSASLLATQETREVAYLVLSQSAQSKPDQDQSNRKKLTQREGTKDVVRATSENASRQAEASKGAMVIWKENSRQGPTVKPQADLVGKLIDGDSRTNFSEKLDGLAISADGDIVAGWRGGRALSSHNLELRNLKNGSASNLATQQLISSVTFSPSGNQILLGGRTNLSLYKLSKTPPFLNLSTPTWTVADAKQGEVFASEFSPDGKIFASATAHSVTLRETATGRTIRQWLQTFASYAVAFSADGRRFASGGFSGKVIVRDSQSGEITNEIQDLGLIYSLAFSPNRNLLLIGGGHGVVIHDLQAGKTIRRLEINRTVNSVSFFQSGTHFLIGAYDGSVRIGDIYSNTAQIIQNYRSIVQQVLVLPRDRGVIVGTQTDIYSKGLNRLPFQQVFERTYDAAEKAHRELPKSIRDRQASLEKSKPVKDEFESNAQFNLRVVAWNSSVEALNKEVKNHYERLGPLPLSARANAVELALQEAYGNPILQDIRYDPELARFFAVLTASANSDFRRNISIAIPNNQARAAKAILESDNSGIEIALTLTTTNELLWGEAKVKLNNITYVAQYTDKDFSPPATAITNTPTLQALTTPPLISTLPQVIAPRVVEDSSLAKLQTEVLRRERETADRMAREAEEKRLRERLAQLKTVSPSSFDDDLTSLIASKLKTGSDPRLYVLAIGINDYADVPDVPFADRSAQAFAEFARKQLGAEDRNVILLTNSDATLGRLRSRMRLLLSRLSPQDRLIIYYAGHGVPSRDGRAAYLLAQDGGPGSYEEPDLNLNQLYLEIEKTKVGQAMLFVDACFSGRAGRDGLIFDGIAPLTVSPKQNIKPEGKVVVLTAGRGDQFSNQLKERGHRLFSYHLMKAMLEDGAKFTASQLHSRIRERVLTDSRQLGPEFEQEPELLGNSRLSIR